MRRIAVTAWAIVLASAVAAPAQSPASLGKPIPVSQLEKPIAVSARVRGQADDTPTLGVPEPYPHPVAYPSGPYNAPPTANAPSPYYPPAAYAPSSYYPPNYGSHYPRGTLTSQSLPHPGYDYTPPPVSHRGDPVRRTSFSSRSAKSESRFGGGARDCASDCCDWVKNCFACEGRNVFESDHSMDTFTSPMTNPFLFEDPRALTEVRPIFIYQTIPNGNPVFAGGEAYFYGTQARVALTDRWSITLNKLGGVTINPGNPAVEDASGLAELQLGPKFTFVRNCESGTAAAVGAIFQIPVGPAKVFQDTGSLSLVPYVSVAQSFGRTSYGTWNFMDTLGYSFGFDSGRSDYFYNSAHIDYDVANLHKFYPLLELNWFYYTTSGDARPITQEGRDLANIGGTDVSGNSYLTIAPGFRYKFSERVQFGLATEFAVTNPRDLQDFRLLVDMIFRY